MPLKSFMIYHDYKDLKAFNNANTSKTLINSMALKTLLFLKKFKLKFKDFNKKKSPLS